ncbi:hypothetical protein [Helicobacter pylori]|uniref:hypothetical protein n=1 Tax=Helicobacter pylori TaxID=210 RepID=UPI0039E0CFD3
MIAIFGVLSAKKMEKKLEDVKAYCCEVEEAITKAYGVIDDLLAVERVVNLFTRQIAKCDALFFSLSQDAITTMRKHNYNHSLYSQMRCTVLLALSRRHRHDEKTQLRSFSLQPRRKRSALRYGFNSHNFERFFESPHHRQTPKAPREGEKGFGDHERADR